MRTLIIFNDFENPLQFLVVEGDYSRFHGVTVNGGDGVLVGEFIDFMYDELGNRKHEEQWTTDKSAIENKDWDKVAICSWIP